jgi:hypothetical protein
MDRESSRVRYICRTTKAPYNLVDLIHVFAGGVLDISVRYKNNNKGNDCYASSPLISRGI